MWTTIIVGFAVLGLLEVVQHSGRMGQIWKETTVVGDPAPIPPIDYDQEIPMNNWQQATVVGGTAPTPPTE